MIGAQRLLVGSNKRGEEKGTMKLDPKLGRTDRITNVVIGAALVVYAFLGPLDKLPLQVVVVGIGLVFIVGGFGGT